ncbi:MAG: hypothetical protein IPL23_00755 [Saprospiraceae bacterium]|nr:hypothetical protein [Saprospiraceae bacterium]
MKTVLLLTSTLLLSLIMNKTPQAPGFDFDKAWKQVDSLQANGFREQLGEKLDEIFDAAKIENKAAHAYSAFSLKMNSVVANYDSIWVILNKELNQKQEPKLESLLYAYKGNMVANALQYQDRTDQTDVINQEADLLPSEMSPVILRELAYGAYFKALENKSLREMALEDFKVLPISGSQEDSLFYKNLNIADVITKDFIAFMVSDQGVEGVGSGDHQPTEYLSKKADFLKLSFKNTQSDSRLEKVAAIYQALMEQRRDEDLASFYIDKIRLDYFKSVFADNNSQTTHETRLQEYTKDKNIDVSLLANLELLNHKLYDEQALNDIYKKANDLKNSHSKSKFADKIAALLGVITHKNLEGKFQKVYSTSEKVQGSFTFKNLKELNYAVYKLPMNEVLQHAQSYDRESIEQLVTKGKRVLIATQKVTKDGFKTTKVDLSLGKLPLGIYLLEVTGRADNESTTPKYTLFQVSDMLLSQLSDNGTALYVNHRKDGKPIKDVSISYYSKSYRGENPVISKNESRTDKEGKSTVGNRGSFAVVAVSKKDTLITIDDQVNMYGGNGIDNNSYKNAIVYTDRAIYRPGQTVHYKVILNETNQFQSVRKIVSGYGLTTTFYDANGQIVEEHKSEKTNAFGSISGSFVIPKGRLNGFYTISTPFGGASLKVEEYKRPSFEILKVDRKKAATRAETSTVTIKAIGLAGNPITNAQVKYRVERTIASPRCYWWFPQDNVVENILIGSDQTDSEGKFELSFEDKSELVPKPVNKVIIYTVYFDVTDQAGETQSFSESMSFSGQSMYLIINAENYYDLKDTQKITISAFNPDMDTITADVQVKIYKEKNPETWRNQEAEDFRPYGYRGDLPTIKTDIKKLVEVKSFKTKTDQSILMQLGVGRYLITAQSVTDTSSYIEKWVEITDFEKKKFPAYDLVYTKVNKSSFEPGEVVNIEVGSSENIYSRLIIKRGNEILKNEILNIKKQKTITYKITEADRGGVKVMLYTILENKVVNKSIDLLVPWSNKVIDIKVESFRDKILPGSTEDIILSLLHKGKPVEAELMATLFDGSLEMLQVHNWVHDLYGSNYAYIEMRPLEYGWRQIYNRGDEYPNFNLYFPNIPSLREHNQYYYGGRGGRMVNARSKAMSPAPMERLEESAMASDSEAKASPPPPAAPPAIAEQAIEIRENLNESVFFYPNLTPDKNGKVTIHYKMNDALTRWKLMLLAHDKDMKMGYEERFIVTQKPLMIKPNKPRLIRFGDELVLSANVSNLSEKDYQSVNCELILKDFIAESSLSWADDLQQKINLKSGETKAVFWKIKVPEFTDVSLLEFTVLAKTSDASDAERDIIPIVTNQILITETFPFNARAKEEKSIKFNLPALKNGSVKQVAFEFTSDPAWTAFVALPTLNGATINTASQLMRRIYTDKMGLKILEDAPGFKKALIAQLASGNKFQSKLQENEELKYVLLQATPYVGMAKAEVLNYEGLQKFLNINNVTNEITSDIAALSLQQNNDGGFAWQKDFRSSPYITAAILKDIARLKQHGIETKELSKIAEAATIFILKDLEVNYQLLKKRTNLNNYTVGSELHTISILSYFMKKGDLLKNEAFKFYFDKHMEHWNKVSIYDKAILGLLAIQFGNESVVNNVAKYFDQTKRTSPEMGTYWEERSGFGFYQMPISLQADIIDFYVRKGKSGKEIDEMKIWLIKQKQTNTWINSNQTADVVHALLLKGSKKEASLTHSAPIVSLNGKPLAISINEVGYLKTYLDLNLLSSSANEIKVKNNSDHLTYGAIYVQYYEQADKVVKKSDNPLTIKKTLYKEVDGKNGKELIALKAGESVRPGDVITSRIFITVDRDMDFVTLSDARPAGFEPQKGEGAYGYWFYPSYSQAITDYQANYFFQNLQKGTKVIENKIIAVHKGNYSGGVATIQSSYSPEFTSHSEGVRVLVQ